MNAKLISSRLQKIGVIWYIFSPRYCFPIFIHVQIERRRSVKTSQFVVKPTVQAPDTSKKVEVPVDADFASEAMFRAEAEKDMDEEEELFNVEESLPNPETYSWEDKYRPRKPRYLNKVHTGYEWNKYNQTHYEYAF